MVNLPTSGGPEFRTKLKRLFWILGIQIVFMAGLAMLGLDIYAHKKLDPIGAANMWGYRGPVAHAKRSREVRIALVGGSRAFGWGLMASATTASDMYTRMMLVIDRPGTDPPPLTVVNLGRVGNVVGDYPHTIERYSSLQLDYICLYDNLGIRDADTASDDSGIFALTGYLPILPQALREKGLSLRFGSVSRGYANGSIAPAGSSVRRAIGLGLEAVGTALMSMDRALGRRIHPPEHAPPSVPAAYAERLQTAIDVAHQHARGVVVVVSPTELEVQRENLLALESLRRRCVASPWCRFVDLDRVPQASDPKLRLDTWNYGGDATWAVADAIQLAVLELMGYR